MKARILFSLSLLFLFACSGSKETDQGDKVMINADFARYISSFTGGTINADESITVVFIDPVSDEVREEDPTDAFSFQPATDGTAEWKDERTLQFFPEEPLASGIRYKASVAIDEFIAVEDDLSTFEFNFRTAEKNYFVSLDQFQTYSPDDFSKQRLFGTVKFTGNVDTTKLAQFLQVTQEGESKKVQWVDQGGGVFGFTVENILRKAQRSDLTLEWKGEVMGMSKSDVRKIKIPAKDEFVVMDYEVVQSPEQHIRVHFSDPLDPDQFLSGLVYLEDNEVSLVQDGQMVIIYPNDRIVGNDVLKIERGIRNTQGKRLDRSEEYDLYFEDIAPDFELLGEGNIIPREGEAHFPFSAVNLKAVDITITKIFEDNMIQFLQVNDYDGTYQLRRVSREVYEERLDLDPEGTLDLRRWNNYSIDLSEYIEINPGCIYRIEISAKKEYALYNCSTSGDNNTAMTGFQFASTNEPWSEEGWGNDYYYDYYYDYDYDYDYSERKNPCNDSYYRNKKITRNVLVSDLGMMAKAGDDKEMHIFLTNLITTEPISGATVDFYDYQQQHLGQATTDGDGMLTQYLDRKPFVAIASYDGQKGYLKLNDGNSLSMSKFDVSGEALQDGIKGMIYTERGVWRPGDSIYISFMMEDKADLLPENHPVKFQLTNPKGVVVQERTSVRGVNGLYDFRTATDMNDITGNYGARVTVGNRSFYKRIKVETVKPNRLKIELTFDDAYLSAENNRKVDLHANWLHGAVSGGLKTKVDLHLTASSTTFKKYSSYVFDDPIKTFETEDKTIFEGKLDEQGDVRFDHNISLEGRAPGMLKAYFKTKVFESGGAFSVDQTVIDYSPYTSYAGLRVPEGSLYGGALVTDKNHSLDIVTVNEAGKPVNGKVNVEVYKLEWRWWWDTYDNDLASYIARTGTVPFESTTLNTSNGKATYNFRVNQPSWGRYLILVEDQASGHRTGQIVYVDWPYYARANRRDAENATMLTFSTDKESYVKGEDVQLSIPTPASGRALVSIESGTKIIEKFWVETEEGETKCSFTTTDQMDPNVFVHVTLIQPYANVNNDLPIRMYGVIPIEVEDPASHLNPVIQMQDVLRPESQTKVQVGEKDKKPMTYTLAIVDEGLLDLTNFSTPDPWTHFNAREALGVKTWDMYNYVLGTYGETLDKLLAVGGDADGLGNKGAQASRFKPMVRFMGPFEYDGSTNTHVVDIPNYVGSVRVMVIAGENNAYGNAEKTVPVRNPLMVLGTLPRVVGPGEKVTLPVDVFAMEDGVKNVSVTVKTNDFFTINGSKTKKVTFSKVGDKIVNFDLSVAEKTGVGTVEIIATSGSKKATYDFEIDVRTPNTMETRVEEKVLNPGESFDGKVDHFGISGTQSASLEVSNFPPLDLGKRLDYLMRYPHGCIEQTTSSVFPQLYLDQLLELSSAQKKGIQDNVMAGINRIQLFQTAQGGFAYWPGGSVANEWGSNYAGHFLLEAEKKGYNVPSSLKSNWLKYQKNKAKTWSKETGKDAPRYDDLIQAYRLYTLALAGKADLGLMNRLRELPQLSNPAKWRLAAAYSISGQSKAAYDLINATPKEVPPYQELSYSFGSNVRDEAMILETLVLMNQEEDAAVLAKKIADQLNADRWMNTQTTAFCLLGVSRFIGERDASEKLSFAYAIDSDQGKRNTNRSYVQFDLQEKNNNVKITNNGNGVIYVRLISRGIPLAGEENSFQNNINLSVKYLDLKNNPISINELSQGQDFQVKVTVSNPGVRGNLKELALSHIVPSGWEIHNERMNSYGSGSTGSFTYQDIRDDRVYTYFDLGANRTKTFTLKLNSSYLGHFYLPSIKVSAMYDESISAQIGGKWVDVVLD